MDLVALPQSISSFLDALIPSLSQAVFLAIFLLYLLGKDAIAKLLEKALTNIGSPTVLAEDAFVRESGMLKLVPVAVLFCSLLAVVSLARLISFIGDQLPGQLYYHQPALMFQSLPADQLADFWSLYPAASDPHTLYLVVDQQITLLEAKTQGQTRFPWAYHEERWASSSDRIANVKFYLLLGLAVCVASWKFGSNWQRATKRYFLSILLAIPIAGYSGAIQIEALRQSQSSKLNFLLAHKISTDKQASETLGDKSKQEHFREMVQEYLNAHAEPAFSMGQ
ncbi:hypothetical protein C7S18_09465 [Ahniella affigens]|uniref:Uncharacterized protein n=1 Tax=Ahniella affigens TaxID=2021234 RepID=A0A2P1PRC9_9GAMM|nr:hypothetical protein [Ahniella affigens]AVP97407.1 hypothetical protein C7S18_09465 [Ahniella affigens]